MSENQILSNKCQICQEIVGLITEGRRDYYEVMFSSQAGGDEADRILV